MSAGTSPYLTQSTYKYMILKMKGISRHSSQKQNSDRIGAALEAE